MPMLNKSTECLLNKPLFWKIMKQERLKEAQIWQFRQLENKANGKECEQGHL